MGLSLSCIHWFIKHTADESLKQTNPTAWFTLLPLALFPWFHHTCCSMSTQIIKGLSFRFSKNNISCRYTFYLFFIFLIKTSGSKMMQSVWDFLSSLTEALVYHVLCVVYMRAVCVCERGTIQASPHSFAPNPPLHAGLGARVWEPEAGSSRDKIQRWWRS